LNARQEPSVGRIDALTVNGEANLPDLLVDRLQIELVLRNLISNAAEAIDPESEQSGSARSATIRSMCASSSPTMVPASRPQAASGCTSRSFRARRAAWSWGRALSRAIAEAHGGSLEAMPGPHGEFCLVPPAEAAHD
jgi:two-component system, LuxR family, sensor kinase FixL